MSNRPRRTHSYRPQPGPITHHDTAVMHAALGALLGSMVGDALGAPFEFGRAGEYTRRFPTPVLGGRGEMVGGGGFGWAPGEFTDDSQMAVALADSILQAAGDELDLDDLWRRWRAWASTAADVGIITRMALGQAEHAGAAETAHESLGRSAGNGALMRSTPLALVGLRWGGLDDPAVVARIIDWTLRQAALTHHDPAAGWGAVIHVELVRRTILGADVFADDDRILRDVVGLVPDGIREQFAAMLSPDWIPGSLPGEPGNGSVWGCLAAAVWAVRHHATFDGAVIAAIDLGGDTDTVACVTGALAGARATIQGIPSRWTTYVHGHVPALDIAGDDDTRTEMLDNAALQSLARVLVGRSPAVSQTPEWPAAPEQLAPGIWLADLGGATEFAQSLHPDEPWAVISMCLTGGAFDHLPVRREVYMIDQPGDANTHLLVSLDDAVRTIEAWRAEGRDVLIHCHGGRSRTTFVAKAWAMRHLGLDADAAHIWLADGWHRYSTHNPTFMEVLAHEWTDTISTDPAATHTTTTEDR
ncbi:MAG: hypothetical protein RJB65_2187 [Actinomycetota bacterium]